MFRNVTPESVGIQSSQVKKVLERLNKAGLVTHGLTLIRGKDIFGEFYWKPFHKDGIHREYSQTKSFAGIAIGLLEQEGKLSLDQKVCEIFPDKIDGEVPEWLKEQTVRDMLTMTTSCRAANWFVSDDPDRTHIYLNNTQVIRPAGTLFEYDSPGSQVLGAIAERLSEMPLLDYLKSRLFDEMGTFKTAKMLKTANGDSWADSALLATQRDMASVARLLLDGGRWEGKQLLNEKFVKDATSKLVDNCVGGFTLYNCGYGYQIWRLSKGFFFNGMGCQFTMCIPELDVIMVINSDNQGYLSAGSLIWEILDNGILENIGEPLPENKAEYEDLMAYADRLELFSVKGIESSFQQELNGKTYKAIDEKGRFKEFRFQFTDDVCEFHYENEQGKKTLQFAMNKNVFGKFPELGYSDEYGTVKTTNGFMYDCAVSGAWQEPKKLMLKVQIIDKYFGNLAMVFAFKGDLVTVSLIKTAEYFLREYEGQFVAKLVK